MRNEFIICEEDELLQQFILDEEPFEELTLDQRDIVYDKIAKNIQENEIEGRVPVVNFSNLQKENFCCQAFKGDDEITVDLTGALGSVMISVTQTLLKVEISWSDTGISSTMGNYAEEWILPPLSKNSTYVSSTTYAKEDSIPWTLDTVKLKLLSPVRKQSQLEDDLESKLAYLGAAAAWCHPNWFTYDFHHTSIILAMETFDFHGADTFPFLNKEDGGLSCPIPWGNPITLWFYANHYKRGRSITAIGSIIHESNKVKTGLVTPDQTFFLKGINAYKSGSALWGQYISTMNILQNNQISEIEIHDLIKASLEVDVPEALREKALVIDINDTVIAVSISRLRSAGELITELDLLASLNEYERYLNLFADKPFAQLYKEQELRNEKVRARPLQVLNTIAVSAPVKLSKAVPSTITFNDFITESVDYMKFSRKYQAFRTSFNNTGKVRVYRSADVRQYFDSFNRREFLLSLANNVEPSFRWVRMDVLPEDEENWRNIVFWLKNPDPFITRIPVGVCTDDARLLHELHNIMNVSQFVICVTNDRDLSLMLKKTIESHNRLNRSVPIDYANLTVTNYLILCHVLRFKPRSLNKFNTLFNTITSTPVELNSTLLKVFETEIK